MARREKKPVHKVVMTEGKRNINVDTYNCHMRYFRLTYRSIKNMIKIV